MAAGEALDKAGGAGGGLFVRNATGLVRQVSLSDMLIMNTIGMNLGIGVIFLILQAQSFFPAGNMIVAVVIGTLLMGFTITWVYSEFSSSMPRSGGDYVYVSRVLHPVLGWVLGWNQAVWLIFFWIGFNAWFVMTFAVPTTLQVLGYSTGHLGLVSVAETISKPVWIFIFGTVINLFFAAVLIFRRAYWRYQRFAFLLAALGLVITVALVMLRAGHFPAAWNSFASKQHGLRYGQILPAAARAGYHPASGFSFGASLLMLPWVFFVVGYGVAPAQISGEVKRASKSMFWGLSGAVLINGAVLAVITLIVTLALGTGWLGAVGAVPSAGLGLAVQPGLNLFGSILTRNPILLILMGLGFVLWALNPSAVSELMASRYMIAAGMDRVAPRWLSKVSDRFNTPVNAIIVCTIGGELAILALINFPEASLLGALLSQMVAYILVGLAGVAFPYRLPQVWESGGGRRLLGIPRIAVAGAASVIVIAWMLISFAVNPTINGTFGVTRTLSLVVTLTVLIVGLIWYAVSFYFNRSRGIDLRDTYREVPPE